MKRLLITILVAIVSLAAMPTQSASTAKKTLTRVQALQALNLPVPEKRGEAVIRLGEIGNMLDAPKLVSRLSDDYPVIRQLTEAALWQIWSRSGDVATDALYAKGVELMSVGKFDEALAVFTDIIKSKPAFAEAWNKRATVHFMMGQFEPSMKDCDEVLKRNPYHFGALSGYAQMYARQGNPELALEYYERALRVHPYLNGAQETLLMLRKQAEQRRKGMI